MELNIFRSCCCALLLLYGLLICFPMLCWKSLVTHPDQNGFPIVLKWNTYGPKWFELPSQKKKKAGPSRRCPSAIPGGPERCRGTEPPKRPMGSNELLPPSKLRRSQRLSGRNRDSEESPEATPPSLCNVCGPTRSSPKPAAIMLVQLPLELLFKILQYCDAAL
ncbi:hypothetical protein V5799_027137 [Amblyomma americanum]|uniref:Uncharacterized protein n=1 Tax=Amblyomma americanum TaxID=6943 RepID=A0AAQ4DGK7_AMBAM